MSAPRQSKIIALYMAFAGYGGLAHKTADLANDPDFDEAMDAAARMIIKIGERSAEAAQAIDVDSELKQDYLKLAKRIHDAFGWAPSWKASLVNEASK